MQYCNRAEEVYVDITQENKSEYTAIIYAARITSIFMISYHSDHLEICDSLLDLILFLQFKKHGKHPRRSVTFSKVAGGNLELY